MLFGIFGLAGVVVAAPGPLDSAPARISKDLIRDAQAVERGAFDWTKMKRGRLSGERLKVHVTLRDGTSAQEFLSNQPEFRNGAEVQVVLGSEMQLGVGFSDLKWLAEYPEILHIRRPLFAESKEVVSEGVESLFDGSLENISHLSGRGVQVAILDVGFEGYEALVGSELPIETNTSWLTGDWSSDSHGTVVAEIVHDVAPGASISLHNFETELEFREILMEFAEGRIEADVINASIGFDNAWQLDGSSPYSQAVDAVSESGILYVAAAGNEAENYSSGSLSDSDDDGWLEIDGMESIVVGTRSSGSMRQAKVSLRWSDAMEKAETDLDLWVFEEDLEAECGRGDELQDGEGSPYESVECETDRAEVVVRISAEDGEDFSGKRAWIYSSGGIDEDFQVAEQTLSLPADARTALTVGAYLQEEDSIAWYSSQGPTEDGRIKPDLVGPTGVSTETMGFRMAHGSSFAAPHLTGLAALFFEDKPSYSSGAMKEYLQGQVRDLGPEGPDPVFGEGAVWIQELPQGCGCSTSRRSPLAAWTVALVFFGMMWRRQ